MIKVKLLLFLGALFVAEATINICIPLTPSNVTSGKIPTASEVLSDIKNDISRKLSNNSETLHVGHVDVNISHPAIRLEGTLDDLDILNLLDFQICLLQNLFINSSTIGFDVFNVTFSNLRLEGKYNLTGDLGDIFDIGGAGDFWVELRNVSLAMVNFTISLNLSDEFCFPVNFDVYVQAAWSHFNNFLNNEELEDVFDGVIHAILPESLRIIWGEIKDIFDQPLEDAINDILHHHDVSSIVNIFKMKDNANAREWQNCFPNDKPSIP